MLINDANVRCGIHWYSYDGNASLGKTFCVSLSPVATISSRYSSSELIFAESTSAKRWSRTSSFSTVFTVWCRIFDFFFWEDFERQVIINGTASKTPKAFSTKYFNSRPKGSKLGALVSENQSSIIKSKDEIIKKFNNLSNEYLNKEIQRPDYWGGYIIKPIKYEFWQGGENRLHDRIRYTWDKNFWKIVRLSP